MSKKASRIILDEEAEAERLFSIVPTSIRYKDIFIMAKYLYSKGENTMSVKNKLLGYCESSETYNYVVEGNTLDSAIKNAKLYDIKKSGLKIGITKKETDILGKLSHRDYRVALYILYVSKLEKYQSSDGDKNKPKRFECYFSHGIEDAVKSCSNTKMSRNAIYDLSHRLFLANVLVPKIGRNWVYWEVICSDFDSKKFEFIIDSSCDFNSQIQYYCVNCGKKLEKKSKMHELCDECHSTQVKEKDRIRKSL
ncbi:MAG: hypothetical protein WA061_02190 [Microgenomates group bacterium]